MMLHTWIPCGKDLFNMGIYGLIQTNIFHCMYFHVCETQHTRMHVTDTTATPNGHQMAVVTCDLSIETEPWFCACKFEKSSEIVIHTSSNHKDGISEVWQLWFSLVILNIWCNYSESYFLQNWTNITLWITIHFIENYWHIIYWTNFPKYFPFAHIYAHILCIFRPCLIRPKLVSKFPLWVRGPQC